MDKLKLWDSDRPWTEAEKAWDESAKAAAKEHPLKLLKQLPDMPGITPETAHRLKWKSLKYMVAHDPDRKVLRGVLRHPFKHAIRYLRSLFSSQSHGRDGDFFLYGVKSLADFEPLLRDPNSIFVMGFSYCHKPFECPSGRFSDQCVHDTTNPVCRQCFIGKSIHAAPKTRTEIVLIPTVHHIGAKIFEIQAKNPGKPIVFMITACELTLKMFADWGNMAGIRGVGVRLDGRICNTMKAFELSERGTKPGLTVVLDDTQKQMLAFIRLRREAIENSSHD